METTDKSVTLFQEIGKVLYAIAIADKTIHPNEYETVRHIVKENWSALVKTTDSFGSNTAYQTEIVFDWLYENDHKGEELLDNFETFKSGNTSLFTKELKKNIIKAANAVAASFSGKNKSELIALGKLQLILKQTP